jgi:hypothetical protein
MLGMTRRSCFRIVESLEPESLMNPVMKQGFSTLITKELSLDHKKIQTYKKMHVS